MRNSRPVVRGIAGLRRDGGVVLRYHSVSDDPEWGDGYIQRSLVVSPEVFDRQVEALVAAYRVVGMDELAGALAGGQLVQPGTVAITFDDGYEDNYRVAFPILRKHGATATFYVTTGAVGDADILWTVGLRRAVVRTRKDSVKLGFMKGHRDGGRLDLSSDASRRRAIKAVTGAVKRMGRQAARDALAELADVLGPPDGGDRRVMMDWDELREMRGSGMLIGAHTVSHYNLPSLDTDDLVDEVVTSRRVLERELDAPIDHFAYPDGGTTSHCDARVARVVADAGFRSGATSLAGPVTSRFSPYCIPRLGVVPRHDEPTRFAADIEYSRLRHQDRNTLARISEELAAGGPPGRGPGKDDPRDHGAPGGGRSHERR